MNITKLALSLSLLTLVAQPTQAMDYKKAAKIAFHAGQLFFGLEVIYHLKSRLAYLELTATSKQPVYKKAFNISKSMVYPVIAIPTFIYYGYTGLKKELCPDFNPVAWLKNKLD